MSAVENLEVSEAEAGLRLDRWFKGRFPGLSHGHLAKLLRTGQVRVDGRRAKANLRLASGQVIRVPPFQAVARPSASPTPVIRASDRESLERAVLFRDPWVLAIDKPAGLAVQGGTGQRRHLDAMLEALRDDRNGRPRLVHRLDKDTSGVLLLARNAEAARFLTAAFRDKTVRKTYWAAVAGVPPRRQGTITLALGKERGSGIEKVRTEGAGAKAAATAYQLAERRGSRASWLVLCPLTGRTHQLRAHCAALGTPILGDGKYGGRAAFLRDFQGELQFPGQLQLHAREVAFPHPSDGTTVRVTAPLPPHMRRCWKALGFKEEAGEIAALKLEEWLPSALGMLS